VDGRGDISKWERQTEGRSGQLEKEAELVLQDPALVEQQLPQLMRKTRFRVCQNCSSISATAEDSNMQHP